MKTDAPLAEPDAPWASSVFKEPIKGSLGDPRQASRLSLRQYFVQRFAFTHLLPPVVAPAAHDRTLPTGIGETTEKATRPKFHSYPEQMLEPSDGVVGRGANRRQVR